MFYWDGSRDCIQASGMACNINLYCARPNKQAPESKPRKEVRAKQPDALISHIRQLSYDCSLGQGEVKIEEYANDKFCLAIDLIKLATFNKDTIDEQRLNACFAFQAVGKWRGKRSQVHDDKSGTIMKMSYNINWTMFIGHQLTAYITKLSADGLYVMTEIASFDIPRWVEELDRFVTMTNLRKLMTITTCSWDNCYQSSYAMFVEQNRRPTLSTSEYKAIINSSRDRRRSSALFFNSWYVEDVNFISIKRNKHFMYVNRCGIF